MLAMLIVESTVHRTVMDQAGSFEASTRTRGDKTRTRHKKLSCRTHENALSVVCLFPPPPSATRMCRPKILAWIGGGIAGFVRLRACDRCAEEAMTHNTVEYTIWFLSLVGYCALLAQETQIAGVANQGNSTGLLLQATGAKRQAPGTTT